MSSILKLNIFVQKKKDSDYLYYKVTLHIMEGFLMKGTLQKTEKIDSISNGKRKLILDDY